MLTKDKLMNTDILQEDTKRRGRGETQLSLAEFRDVITHAWPPKTRRQYAGIEAAVRRYRRHLADQRRLRGGSQ